MATKICLDSGVILDFLTGDDITKQKIKLYSNEELFITAITLFEIRSAVEHQETVSELLGYMNVAPFDDQAAEVAAHIIKDDLRQGNPRNTKNAFNAAICIANSMLLFTNDRAGFEGIKGLKLV